MNTTYDALVTAVDLARGTPRQEDILRVLDAARAVVHEAHSAAEISDGYHTMLDLYHHRMLLNAALFNVWNRHLPMLGPYKSRKHHDEDNDPMFRGQFIVGADLPGQGQVRYHYDLAHWDLFQIPELPNAHPYDGADSDDVADRIQAWIQK